ncbi:MAG: ribosomal protein S18-alanine N-acetyltransferase [Clostridia bacterium]|nr:ribosomal protein S18-alanine N-acetyltransferase [Clostridia bacterium]
MTQLLTQLDLDDVCFIEQVCFGKDAWNKNMLESEYNGGSVFFGIKRNEKVVAYISARIIIDEADINNVAVLPEFRKQGMAQKLVDALAGYCENKGVKKFTLEVNANNTPAKNLYQKMGFVSFGVRKGYYHGEDAEIMWLDKEQN